ncbi:MAG: alpha/beta fold hydrolase [Alphaproteobacteria bacterium]|nr:alpha/beta fold hydrolase [Alphaproteobacteria bacterium]
MKKFLLFFAFALALGLCATPAWAEGKAVQISGKGGLTLNAQLSLAPGKHIKDGVVLITHGTLAHNGMQIITSMQTHLAGHGVNTLALTLNLGLGDRKGMYDCMVPHRHLYTDALDDIGAWLAWLKSQGATKVALMGHSRGGAQTAWFAAERPDPVVTKVILLAPMTWNETSAREQYQARFGKSLDEPLARALALVKAGKGGEMMAQTDFLACPATSVSAAAFESYYRAEPRFHTPALLPRIRVPVLVVAASDDQLIKGLPEAVKPLADGKKVRLVTIPDADHFFNNFAAEDAAEAVAGFLKD